MGDYRQLAEIHDDHGVIRVVEAGDYRFLEFGDEVEQSCSYRPDPAWLEYDYTRAMLLGALLPARCERALFLGLGGGSLTMACLKWLPLGGRGGRAASGGAGAGSRSSWGWPTIRGCRSASAMRAASWPSARRRT